MQTAQFCAHENEPAGNSRFPRTNRSTEANNPVGTIPRKKNFHSFNQRQSSSSKKANSDHSRKRKWHLNHAFQQRPTDCNSIGISRSTKPAKSFLTWIDWVSVTSTARRFIVH